MDQLYLFGRGGTMSVAGARDYISANLDEGVRCPCCDRWIKRYKRRLNSNMAMFLIDLVKVARSKKQEWTSYREVKFRGRDYPYLIHWNLMETLRQPGSISLGEPDTKNSGIYKPTELGLAFVHRLVKVPSHIYLVCNEVEGFSDAQVDIVQALGRRFDYAELMAPRIDSVRLKVDI